MEIREAKSRDRAAWVRIRRAIWPHASAKAHERDFDAALNREDGRCFVVVENDRDKVAYVECRIEAAGEDEASASVGHIEGWYIVPNYRAGGIGSILLKILNLWFQARGCSVLRPQLELADDVAFKANTDQPAQDTPLFFNFSKR